MSPQSSRQSLYVTKSEFKHGLHGMRTAMQVEIRAAAKEIISYVSEGFARIDQRFVGVDNRFAGIDGKLVGIEGELVAINTKLEAIMSGELFVTREQLLVLVNELKSHGIAVDTDKLFRKHLGSDS